MLLSFIFTQIRELASRAIFFGLNLASDIWMRYWIRLKMAYQGRVVTVTNPFGSPPKRVYSGTNYPLLAFLLLTPAALLSFGYFTGLLDYGINFSLSFVFFFFNLFYFIVHTAIYVVLYIPVALFDFGLKYMSAIFDYGILAHLPFSSHVPTLGSYLNGLNLIGLLNAFFYGAHAASMAGGNASLGQSFGLTSSPPTLGDFTWRPVTVDLNNPHGPRINPPLNYSQKQSLIKTVWTKPVTSVVTGSSGGISTSTWSGNGGVDPTVEPGGNDGSDSATYWLNYPDDSGGTNTVNYGSNVGASTLQSAVVSALSNSGTSLSAVHNDIDSHTGGTVANYDPVSDGGTSAVFDTSSLGSAISSAVSSAISQPGKVIATVGSAVSSAIGKISSWW